MIIDKLNTILFECEFKEINDSKANILNFLHYRNKQINVFIKNITKENIGEKELNEMTYSLREELINERINIFNSYVIFCIECNMKEEDLILIERNSKYIRKYVVRDEFDFQRIHFLDKTPNLIDSENKYLCDIENTDKYVLDIIKEMLDCEGEIKPLPNPEIKLIVKKIIEEIGGENEN